MIKLPDISKYLVPALGVACVGGALLAGSGMRPPVGLEPTDAAEAAEARVPKDLVLSGYIPTMEQVVAKHLFVPERVATGENAFPDLLVKGVYVGETQRNAVFSLKSKPEANLRVWQGDEDAAMAQVTDERDPRQPIVDFLSEWHIKSIDFAGVTLEQAITGEVETYEVDYKPLKHAKASAGAGYGQGYLDEAISVAAKTSAGKPASASQPAKSQAPPGGSTQAIAGRVGQYMQRLSPEQRQQFMQQLQKQNAASAKKNGESSQQNNNGGSSGKKSDGKKSGGGGSGGGGSGGGTRRR
ncbi:hypothetical protein PDESU_05579 [Pontiella desulfatans]|uniref:Uncharacterized protein n=1 Tax=Pontiella desulfatans TaxID=2750659 RepID=A0A6C2UAF9_PONDE|nr:hypothetical protein [Pontiella desulfatans]VGO16985.1 hypothetical protein PDESU_05579 [Pontiella desulfatans]